MRPVIIWTFLLVSSILLCFYISMWFLIPNILIDLIILADIFFKKDDKEFKTIGFDILFSMRKIHTEWGTFWIYLHQDKNSFGTNINNVYILTSNLFTLSVVGDPFRFSNLDDMKTMINLILDRECGYEKRMNDESKLVRKSIFKDWNGSTSLQVERDQKLKELL